MTIAGRLTFNPITDSLINKNGQEVKLDPPQGTDLPEKGFEVKDSGYLAPPDRNENINIMISPGSERLQILTPFTPWDGNEIDGLILLIKTKGKCTTDHISMAGPWLRFRGHLDNISDNLLMGATNAFNGKANNVLNQLNGKYVKVSESARDYCSKGLNSVIIAEENYGEGSSREHAAMEPRHLGVKVVITKSFARIHETNLKKQGVLALTFSQGLDYNKIREDDKFDITGLQHFMPGKELQVNINHCDGSTEEIKVKHTYNNQQIEWFRAGSALNIIRGA
jgi:aconitate hydratase